ncbi:MAG: cation transporter, partial [Bdellovibrionaceae bacterium]|nr:cation transporter [Pseudobdellovibrionaceae bacterium]
MAHDSHDHSNCQAHDHGHGHSHHHHHGHAHAPKDFNRAFAIGVSLNVAFVLIEAVFGWLSNSLALLADAGHNLGDVLGLLLAWGASRLALQKPSSRFTYGLRSTSILAALFNSV